MSHVKQIMFAFGGISITRIFRKSRVVDITCFSPRENFMSVTLVRNVENEFILRRRENVVHRDFRLDNAEVRSEMPADLCKAIEKRFSDFRGESFEFAERKFLHVLRSVYSV